MAYGAALQLLRRWTVTASAVGIEVMVPADVPAHQVVGWEVVYLGGATIWLWPGVPGTEMVLPAMGVTAVGALLDHKAEIHVATSVLGLRSAAGSGTVLVKLYGRPL